ncbi:SAM-dependent DNA methyltransferase [bacterium]|nr:SAM-dependent DNA methyltransferase [bacterium]
MPRIPDTFEVTHHYTERTVNQRFVEWINKIIEEKNLDFGVVLQETGLSNRKSPDIIIRESPQSQRVICLIELKLPSFDALSESELVGPASQKAIYLQAPYFATSNIKQIILFSTQARVKLAGLSEQIINTYHITNISDPDRIDEPGIRLQIQRNLERFLLEFYEIAKKKKPVPKKPIDEILICRLHSAIDTLQMHYQNFIRKKITDRHFKNKLKKWFQEQGWSPTGQDSDIERVSRQTAYLLINKVMFYTAMQEKNKLDPISISSDITDIKILQGHLQTYFSRALSIDYETIFTADFIDDLAFPPAPEVVLTLREVIEDVKRYEISKLDFDVIGRIFERLIPSEERHMLGQYFTRSDIVDFILYFCSQKEDDTIFDPACGTGTFLVRAYKQKKLRNPQLGHEKILKDLWGGDIAKFPVSLATVNLSIRDLGAEKNYPGIFQKDFFQLHPDLADFIQPRKVITRALDSQKIELELPRHFDCIVGNPPYTRQEQMEELIGGEGYKKDIIQTVTHYKNKKIAELGKRAGIHAYFFLHSWKFLNEGGRFGFIVSNSWLDVDYGKYVQEFFLKRYKIIAVIESKVERWFEDADINTCIVILEKCSETKARNKNLVQFAYLKKPLSHFIPPADDKWEEEITRRDRIDELKKLVLGQNAFYENEEIRIFPKLQSELWDEGFDAETKEYVGSKWGKYIRAPEIFFKILEKGKDKLVPLKEIADVRFGIKTGANEFFYLTEEEIKRWKIEKEFWMHKGYKGEWIPNYVIRSPRECKSIIVEPKDLKYRVLMIHKDKKDLKKTNILKYLEYGEQKGYHKRPTCAVRDKWYDLGCQNPADGIWFKAFNDRFFSPLNLEQSFTSDRFYAIYLKNKVFKNRLFLYLNSTLSVLMIEIFGRVNLGEGALDNMTYEAASMSILDIRKAFVSDGRMFRKYINRPIENIFFELSAFSPEEVSVSKVKPDRRELDKNIMGEILGLTDEEQLEVYRAVVDLVKSRIEKAKSFDKKKKAKYGVDVYEFKRLIVDRIVKEP